MCLCMNSLFNFLNLLPFNIFFYLKKRVVRSLYEAGRVITKSLNLPLQRLNEVVVQSLQSIVKDCESTRYTSINHKHHSMPCSAWARRWFWKTFPCKTWILRLSWAPLHLKYVCFSIHISKGKFALSGASLLNWTKY